MSSLRRALTEIVADLGDLPFALVGGLAVSARVEPRFTRDIDLAVAVTSDTEAEELVARLRQSGYETAALVEQEATGRRATIRLHRGKDAPTIELLFASSGIEAETVADAEPLTVLGDAPLPVARVAHLLAMKILSDDPIERPQDRIDAIALVSVATPAELDRAGELLSLITSRGANRGRDLDERLRELREATGRGSDRSLLVQSQTPPEASFMPYNDVAVPKAPTGSGCAGTSRDSRPLPNDASSRSPHAKRSPSTPRAGE